MGATAQQLGVKNTETTVGNYFASLLNAVASLAAALLVPTFLVLWRDLLTQHAPGMSVFMEVPDRFFSLRFGILFLVVYSGFYLARQCAKPGLRIVLFWIPACGVTALGFAVWAWGIYGMRLMQPLTH